MIKTDLQAFVLDSKPHVLFQVEKQPATSIPGNYCPEAFIADCTNYELRSISTIMIQKPERERASNI
uniref:Uncharacterized protein n=1 Tax=Romanomermis culicivorax TaxID=13658 RepID=A0A915JFT3_ROMCU